MTLMKNFESFLRSRGLETDPASISDLMETKNKFREFYHGHKMFLYIGENLNRATDQIYIRLFSLYHSGSRDVIPASEDSFILKRTKDLEDAGFHRKFKVVGNEMGRYHVQVKKRVQTLRGKRNGSASEVADIVDELFKLVDDFRRGNGAASLDDIPFDLFAAELGCSKPALEKFWVEVGKKKYARSKLSRWTLEDKDLLLAKVEESGEDEEKCVDFKKIFEEHFREKCVDWQQLREKFIEIRRDVPFYMLNDLQSVVAAVRKDVKQQLLKKAASDKMEMEEVEEEEED